MDLLREIITKAAVMFIIYAIINRAFGSLRHRTKAIIIFVIGITLSGIFLFAYFYDKNNDTIENAYNYFIFIGINIVFAFSFIIYSLINYRSNRYLRYKPKREKFETTSKVYYKRFVYIVFEYQNNYLLKKDKETYTGLNMALKKGTFQDVQIELFLKKHSIEKPKITLYGEYTDTLKKEIYYVYLINLNSKVDLNKFEYFHYTDISNLNMKDLDKELIYRVLIKEKFNIKK